MSTDVTSDAVRRRDEALEVSAWGERFRFFQPQNLCFWVFLVLTGIGLHNIWQYFGPKAGFYAEVFTVSAVLCLLCGGAWAWWFHHIDRWERQPRSLVVTALIWGAIPATFAFAITVNGALLSIYPKLFGQDWADSWAAGMTAPFTEESAKLCGFLLILGLAPRLVRTANDGLIIGAFVGLGFAVFEDFLYAVNSATDDFGTDPLGNAVKVSFTRIAVSFVSHPLFSALVCSGVIYLLGTAAQPRRVGRGVALILAGMFLHFTWDDAAGLGNRNGLQMMAVMLGSIILAIVILTIAFRAAAPREHDFIRDILAPEVEAGVVTETEVEAVVDRHARRTYLKAAHHRRARRARKHLRQAILDLTHDVAIAHREPDSTAAAEDVAHARSEVARLREHAEPAPAD